VEDDWRAAGWDADLIDAGDGGDACSDHEEQPSLLAIWWPILLVGGIGALMAVAAVFTPFLLFSNALDGLELWPNSTAACEDPDEELWLAATNGDLPTIERELPASLSTAEGVDSGHDGWTPLLCAVDHGQPEAAQLLLDAGADPDLATGGRSSPIAVAAADGDADMVDVLLGAGADPDNDLGGTTALHQAAEGEHVAAIEALAAGGADLEATNEQGATALVLAARGHPQAVHALLEGGADPAGISEVDGTEALDLSLILLAATPSEDGALDRPTAIAPLRRGRGPITALHAAAIVADAESLRALLQAGADPNAVAYGAYTPLHAIAAFDAMVAVAEEEPPEPMAPDAPGGPDDRAEVEALLLLAGADPELAPDPTVGTPAELAEALTPPR